MATKRAELEEREMWKPGFSLIRWLEEKQGREPLPEDPYTSRLLPFRYWRAIDRFVTIFEWEDPDA